MNSPIQLSVLLIHDDRAGHLNPSIGVCEQLTPFFQPNIDQLRSPHLSKWAISLLKRLTWYPHFFSFVSNLFYKSSIISTKKKYDLIVCSGMPNLLFSIHIHQKMRIPIYYAGNTRKVNDQFITLTISAIPQRIHAKQLILPTPPVRRIFTDLKSDHLNLNQALLILGGTTTEHPFSEYDYIQMIKNFTALCQEKKITALITNSRRTPDLEKLWLELKDNKNIELHLINDRYSKKLNELISIASYIFVTEDSTSMLAESIQSGRYVCSIYTNQSTLESLTKRYLQEGLIERQAANNEFTLPSKRCINKLDISTPLIDALKENLGYKQ